MIFNSGKAKATQVVAKVLHGGDEVNAEMKPEAGPDGDLLHGLAEDIHAAIQSKSPGDLKEALKAFIDEHGLSKKG